MQSFTICKIFLISKFPYKGSIVTLKIKTYKIKILTETNFLVPNESNYYFFYYT
jgi:hypothetical protein